MCHRMRTLRGLVCISIAIGILITLLIHAWGIIVAIVLLGVGFWQLLW